MLTYLWANQLVQRPLLRDSMFRDHADQFKTRLNWQVKVDENGFEKDEYDALNPLYVIWETPQGLHHGSLRLLPTTGRTMVKDHFSHLMNDQIIPDPKIWECSRFCLARHAARHVASNLMLAAGEAMVGFGVGIWKFSAEHRETVSKKAGVPSNISSQWFDLAFGAAQRHAKIG